MLSLALGICSARSGGGGGGGGGGEAGPGHQNKIYGSSGLSFV